MNIWACRLRSLHIGWKFGRGRAFATIFSPEKGEKDFRSIPHARTETRRPLFTSAAAPAIEQTEMSPANGSNGAMVANKRKLLIQLITKIKTKAISV
jgi:hypothetical protein